MKKLYFTIILCSIIFISKFSFGQCNSVLYVPLPPGPIFCEGDSLTLTGNINNGNTGWDFTIYRDSLGSHVQISDTNSVTARLYVGAIFYFTADSGSCTLIDTIVLNVYPKPVVNISATQTICQGKCALITSSGGNTYSWANSGNMSSLTTSSTVVCPPVTVTYSLTVTNIYGCSNTATSTVIVYPVFPPNLGPDIDICYGTTGQLYCGSTSAVLYSWTPSAYLSNHSICGPTATPPDTMTYTLIVTDTNGCSASDSITVNVRKVTPPPVGTCSGDTLQVFTNPNYAGYQWYYNFYPIVGATDTFYVRTVLGNYVLLVTDVNGCVTKVTTACFDGINDVLGENFFSIYPNPAHGDFSITFNEEMHNASVEIFNVMGEIIYRNDLRRDAINRVSTVNIHSGAGIYFVRVIADGKKGYSEKIIIE